MAAEEEVGMAAGPASIRDVAERAGVALGTVSNVLNRPERVSEPTRQRVLAAIEELGFVRNDAARQLRAGRSRTIGLIVFDIGNPFFTDINRGAEDRALQENLSLLLGNTDGSPEREAVFLDLFEERRVMGLLIAPATDVSSRLEQMQHRGTPTVLVDRRSGLEHISSVSVDDEAGGYAAARHLIDQGCSRLAFVGGPLWMAQLGERLAGASRAVREAGESGNGVALEVIELDTMTASTGHQIGCRLAERPTAQRPDGVFAANDLAAVGMLQALIGAGIAIPAELAVVGYDDIDFASMAAVPLSSVHQPTGSIGRTGVELLIAEVTARQAGVPFRHQHVVYPPSLVVRASSRRASLQSQT